MLLSELAMASGLRYEGEDTDIVSIEYDSRKVKKGSMFCCIVGSLLDGHTFAEGAIENGAAALLVEHELPLNVPQLVVKNARKAVADNHLHARSKNGYRRVLARRTAAKVAARNHDVAGGNALDPVGLKA